MAARHADPAGQQRHDVAPVCAARADLPPQPVARLADAVQRTGLQQHEEVRTRLDLAQDHRLERAAAQAPDVHEDVEAVPHQVVPHEVRHRSRHVAPVAGRPSCPDRPSSLRRQHHELAQREVRVGHRAAGARGVVDVDARSPASRAACSRPAAGWGVPEHAGSRVGVDERRRRLLVLRARRPPPGRRSRVRRAGRRRPGRRPARRSRAPRCRRPAPTRGRAGGGAAAGSASDRAPAAPPRRRATAGRARDGRSAAG